MTSEGKIILITIGLVVCLGVTIFFGIRVPDPSGYFEVTDGTVWGSLKSGNFWVGLDAEIHGQDHLELREHEGVKLDFCAQRVDMLESVFGSLDDLTGMDDETAYPISSAADLEDYVRLRGQKVISEELGDESPEGSAYREKYVQDDIELSVGPRGNIYYRVSTDETVSLEEQTQIAREFAQALKMETYFDFEEPISTDTGLVLPVITDGLPVVAASQNFLSDSDEELWVLAFQGYESLHMGLSLQVLPEEILIQSFNTILPVQASSEKETVISAQDAIEALKDNLGSVYIDGKYPDQHPYNIIEIRLAYGAAYSDGGYILTPIWVFIDEQDLAWDYCFIVNAFTGEVYQSISEEYSGVLSSHK